MEELTKNQEKVLFFIQQFQALKGTSPSAREIMDAVGAKSTRSATQYLNALKRKGYISDGNKGLSRQIKINQSHTGAYLEIPILGKIAAGSPIQVEENVQGYLRLGHDTGITDDEAVIIVVNDNSLVVTGIREGDHVVVKLVDDSQSDDIVAVRQDEDIVLRKLLIIEGKVRLFRDELSGLTEDSIAKVGDICGTVIGLIRKYA